MMLKNICVFAGSNLGTCNSYSDAAIDLCENFIKQNITMVYGGASIGLMGVMADYMVKNGGHIIGVIPKMLAAKEVAHGNLTELHVVENMHERKSLMYEKADAFIALPGGFGTLDEFFEVITWQQIQIQLKPCVLYNVDGYYNKLLDFLDSVMVNGFIKKEHREIIMHGASFEAIYNKLVEFKPKIIDKW